MWWSWMLMCCDIGAQVEKLQRSSQQLEEEETKRLGLELELELKINNGIKIINLLIDDKRVNVNTVFGRGRSTPLMRAVGIKTQWIQMRIIEALLQNKVNNNIDVNIKNRIGNAALHLATIKENENGIGAIKYWLKEMIWIAI